MRLFSVLHALRREKGYTSGVFGVFCNAKKCYNISDYQSTERSRLTWLIFPVQNLTKYYGDKLILQDISFDIQPGEKVAILGANGAGKTTLLNVLTGRLPYDGGHVSLRTGQNRGVIDQMPDFHRNPRSRMCSVSRSASRMRLLPRWTS